MKKTLLFLGIITLVIGIFVILWGLLNWFMFYHVLDGSFDLYNRLEMQMIISFAVGAIFTVGGIICLIVRKKL